MEFDRLPARCVHCGTACPEPVRGRLAFCCSGCAFVHALASADTKVAAFDAADAEAGACREIVLRVDGATCSTCVDRIESALAAVEGVAEASFSLASHRARVRAASHVASGILMRAVAQAGYRASPAAVFDREAIFDRRRSLWRLALAAFAMMQAMMFAWPAYVADEASLSWDVGRLFDLAGLIVTMPVLLFSAQPIFRAAWRGLLARAPGMDLPVAVGIIVSFAASLHGTFSGGAVYYDSIAMFVFFLIGARHLESAALARTTKASEALASLVPERTKRLRGGAWEEIDAASLRAGDHVRIGVGDSAPADLELVSAASDFDEALVTGESAPVAKRAGDRVLAGTVNLSVPVEGRVVACGAEHTIERIRRLVDRAAAQKPSWTLLADRVARHFAWIIVALAVVAALAWLPFEPQRALWVAVATLVATCPCALSLAAPAAMSAAIGRLARAGVLVTRARGLESLANVTHVVFDKTGTLTTGRMRLAKIEPLGTRGRDECLALAAALECALPHPIAHALVAAGSKRLVKCEDARAFPGEGVEGIIDGRRYRIGSPAFCAALCARGLPIVPGAETVATMASEGEWVALFAFEDDLRPEAAAVARRLSALRCELALLSGDRYAVVEPVGHRLGIATRISAAGPEAKAAFVAGLAARGATVAMVGDGVNDAPVLARAHVAIAIGSGAALARSQADLILINPSLHALADAIETARATRRIMRENIAWAIGYNAIALPLALAGALEPWIASLGMSLSSLLVVLNALRLARVPRAPTQSAPQPRTAVATT